VARLLFDATELESFSCSTMQSYQKLSTKTLTILVLFAITYLCKSEFSSLLHLQNKYQNCLKPSNDLRVAMYNIVLGYERIVSKKQ